MKDKKWLIIICSIVLLLVLNVIVEKQNLFKRAIVVGIGIDKKDIYSITIEYLDKEKSITQTIECEDLNTIEDNFFKATGKKLSLSQSILLIVNKDLIEDSIFYYLLEDESIGSHLLLVLAEDCENLMKSKIATDGSVCSLIRDVIYKSKDKVELKDYFIAKTGEIEIKLPIVNIKDGNVEIVNNITI